MSEARWSASGLGDLRASDADRDKTAEVLRAAAAEGRIDLAELEERLERTFAARTYAELSPITADLPGADEGGRLARTGTDRSRSASAPGDHGALTQPGPREINAVLGEQSLSGPWLAPRRMTARAFLGEVKLDLTEAVVPHEILLEVQVGLGQVTLIVPDDIAVVFEGGGLILGSRTNKSRGTPGPGTPVVRVRGTILLGEVVARPPKRRWFRRGTPSA